MEYHERLKAVNANCNIKGKTVWDSIDRPIRPLVYHLNRVGLKTKFSCCGFNYDGEEEPKTHHAELSYVFIWKPTTETGKQAVETLKSFIEISNHNNGVMFKMGLKDFRDCWHLWIKNTIPNLYQHNDGLEKGIHDYEAQVLGIHILTQHLESWESDDNVYEIVDGNQLYQDLGITEWQVKPKKTIAMRVAKNKYNCELAYRTSLNYD